MSTEQLELDLWEDLRRAQQMPETIQVAQMLDAVEATAAQLPEAERLRFAGDALLQLADLCAARAGVLLTEWEESDHDPIVPAGFFGELVRQTMAVDLSELMEPPSPRMPRSKRAKATEAEPGSIAAPVEKTAVLALVDQLEAEALRMEQVLTIAHDENGSAWIEAISQALQVTTADRVSLTQLCQRLMLSPVEVWLAVLAGLNWSRRGRFTVRSCG